MPNLASSIRWKRVAWIAVFLAFGAGLVLSKPLLFPKTLPQALPGPLPPIDIKYNEAYFDSSLARFAVSSLGHQCNASSEDALREDIHFPLSDMEILLQLRGNRLLKEVFHFESGGNAPRGGRVVTSVVNVGLDDQRSLWRMVDRFKVARPTDEHPASIDGPSVDLEACRQGHYVPSIAIGRTSGPDVVVRQIANRLLRLSGEGFTL